MADDSHHIQEDFKFHPCDTPRGTMYYKLTELVEEQQIKLNGHKINIIRQNQMYLNDHPEVKVIISMLLKAILRARPKVTLQEFLSKYFTTAWPDIKKEIDKVVAEKTAKAALEKGGASGSTITRGLGDFESAEEEHDTMSKDDDSVVQKTKMCRGILNEIITDIRSDLTLSMTDIWVSPNAKTDATPYPSEITLYKNNSGEYPGE